jgi:UDP-glucuronate decarboxylase
MKNILVTGGAGFIGSHLCERLVNEGNKVLCVDDLSTGRYKNIAHLLDCAPRNGDFNFVEHDITTPCDWIQCPVDEIYNLACPASPKAFAEQPIGTLRASLFGTYNMLELAKQTGAKFLQASTSEIYGEPESHPQTEYYWGRVNCNGERACYSEGKRAAEALVTNYNVHIGIDTKIVRIFNVYGPRMRADDGRLMPNIINQILNKQPITIYGNGKHTRSFCYVDDMVDGLIKMMESDEPGPINIGNPQEITILSCVKTIMEIMKCSDREIKYLPLPRDDASRRCPDIFFAKDLLKWEPKVLLHEGLSRTIEYYEQNK